jgi:hypothetical protein
MPGIVAGYVIGAAGLLGIVGLVAKTHLATKNGK